MNTITARTRIAGLHCWPDAPERRAYLRHLHRHMFGIAATVEVSHGDRDTEWHDLADVLHEQMLGYGKPWHPETTLIDFGPSSCERIATALANDLAQLGYRALRVEVDEDGEHTATWEPEP